MNNCVGIVDSVSSYEVKGYLLDSAPRSVSLASGLTFFPRINGFLLIPNETGSLVGMISWIGYNHLNSENEVALPKGSRMISLSILGESEVELNVCQAIQTLNQRAEEKGRIETLVQNIKNLMKNMGLTAEQAMSVLDVSESDREAIAPRF